MKIKDVSEKFQISPDTLRYYEKIGLIHNVSRDKNGIRNYSQENCNTIAFIKCMRAASVSIEGLSRYMELFQQGDAQRTASNPHRRTGPFRKPHERYSRGPAAPELENQDVR